MSVGPPVDWRAGLDMGPAGSIVESQAPQAVFPEYVVYLDQATRRLGTPGHRNRHLVEEEDNPHQKHQEVADLVVSLEVVVAFDVEPCSVAAVVAAVIGLAAAGLVAAVLEQPVVVLDVVRPVVRLAAGPAAELVAVVVVVAVAVVVGPDLGHPDHPVLT